MMPNVGFDGGHTLYGLGFVSDLLLLFECIDRFVVTPEIDRDWSLLTDRLYKRYLRREELEPCARLMTVARLRLSEVSGSSVNWTTQGNSGLKVAGNLGVIFGLYFDRFVEAKDSAISFDDEFGLYQPLRIIPYELPDSSMERRRPSIEYDSLRENDLPFWAR